MIGRRQLLAAAAAGVATASLAPRSAFGRGRTPYGAGLALHVPWPVGSLDPHRIDDALAAFFGDALFDTLYARDEGGAVVPALAAGDPQPEGAGLRVPLRPGVRFASGTPLDARAAAASLARARARDASAWLADVPAPRVTADGLGLVFAMRDARLLARALASPLVAVVAPRFTPERPEGTGPFRVEGTPGTGGTLRLVRNGFAASGPSFLDAIDARHAPDLETSLRAFESGADDLGWLGSFLHEPRAGAQAFDAGAVGWVVVRTGKLAGPLDAPGSAQALADGVPHAALAPLVVGPGWAGAGGAGTWSGPPCELLVRDDAPWLIEVGRALAVPLSAPSHEVTLRPAPVTELVPRRAARAFTLMIDVVRPAGPDPLGPLLGLATADDPARALDLARHPPRGDTSPRKVTRSMRIGVVGEIRLQGGRAADVVLPTSPWGRGVDWGNAFRTRR
jgi:peptide/nickel transport system substrate-binding protein